MAFSAPAYKSVGLILAIALVGVIVVFTTVSIQGRQKTAPAGTKKAFSDATSGIVLEAPQDWTIGKTGASTIETHTYRLAEIPSQRSTCIDLSVETSRALQTSLKSGSKESTAQWQQEFPGLVASKVLKATTPSTLYSLVGIDTCNQSSTVRSITFRGQAYKNNVEVQFSHIIFQDNALSQSELNQLAQSLFQGTAIADIQLPFNQFEAAMGSVR